MESKNPIKMISKFFFLLQYRYFFELMQNGPDFDPLQVNKLNQESTAKRIYKSEEGIKMHILPTIQKQEERKRTGIIGNELVKLEARGTVINPVLRRSRPTSQSSSLVYRGGPVVTQGTVINIVWNNTRYANYAARNLQNCLDNLPTFYEDVN